MFVTFKTSAIEKLGYLNIKKYVCNILFIYYNINFVYYFIKLNIIFL